MLRPASRGPASACGASRRAEPQLRSTSLGAHLPEAPGFVGSKNYYRCECIRMSARARIESKPARRPQPGCEQGCEEAADRKQGCEETAACAVVWCRSCRTSSSSSSCRTRAASSCSIGTSSVTCAEPRWDAVHGYPTCSIVRASFPRTQLLRALFVARIWRRRTCSFRGLGLGWAGVSSASNSTCRDLKYSANCPAVPGELTGLASDAAASAVADSSFSLQNADRFRASAD